MCIYVNVYQVGSKCAGGGREVMTEAAESIHTAL